jgi:hypothetical protein
MTGPEHYAEAERLLALSVVKWFGPTDLRANFGPAWESGFSWDFCRGWWSCWCGAGRTGCRSRGCGR